MVQLAQHQSGALVEPYWLLGCLEAMRSYFWAFFFITKKFGLERRTLGTVGFIILGFIEPSVFCYLGKIQVKYGLSQSPRMVFSNASDKIL